MLEERTERNGCWLYENWFSAAKLSQLLFDDSVDEDSVLAKKGGKVLKCGWRTEKRNEIKVSM